MIAQLEKSVRVEKASRLKSAVSPVNADTLIREYKQKRWVTNSEKIGKPDSLSSWYSIEQLEEFIATAKMNGGDGIKFYFAAYPEVCDSKPEYAARQTLVMVATKSKIAECGTIANKDIYLAKNRRVEILSGTLPTNCPPNCAPPSEGGMGDLGITLVDRGEQGMEII